MGSGAGFPFPLGTERGGHARLDLSEIDLIARTVNCLEEEGIFTVRDLLNPHAAAITGTFELRREDLGVGV